MDRPPPTTTNVPRPAATAIAYGGRRDNCKYEAMQMQCEPGPARLRPECTRATKKYAGYDGFGLFTWQSFERFDNLSNDYRMELVRSSNNSLTRTTWATYRTAQRHLDRLVKVRRHQRHPTFFLPAAKKCVTIGVGSKQGGGWHSHWWRRTYSILSSG